MEGEPGPRGEAPGAQEPRKPPRSRRSAGPVCLPPSGRDGNYRLYSGAQAFAECGGSRPWANPTPERAGTLTQHLPIPRGQPVITVRTGDWETHSPGERARSAVMLLATAAKRREASGPPHSRNVSYRTQPRLSRCDA